MVRYHIIINFSVRSFYIPLQINTARGLVYQIVIVSDDFHKKLYTIKDVAKGNRYNDLWIYIGSRLQIKKKNIFLSKHEIEHLFRSVFQQFIIHSLFYE